MNWLKGAPIALALASAVLLLGCESTPSAPDVDMGVAPPAVGNPSGALTTTGPLYGRGNNPMLGEVYVESQGLCFDTFVTAETLPPHGPFQFLSVNGVTEFGPGDPGYLGGRWMKPDGMGGYTYFLCPLLPPGRPCDPPE
jgi:hypothetical protein